MPAVKIQKFLGKAPRISPELLPESVAQEAVNTTFYSGDIFPYYQPSTEVALAKTPPILALYKMENGGSRYWLHWTVDTDVARAPIENDTTQRIYYADGVQPRVTNYSLATTGGTNYPIGYYKMGLPAPTSAPGLSDGGGGAGTAYSTSYCYTYVNSFGEESAPSPSAAIDRQEGDTINVSGLPKNSTNPHTVAISGGSRTTTFRERTSNVAKITTSTAHGLVAGDFIRISSMGGTGYNSSTVIVVAAPTTTTFTYANTGGDEASTADTAGRIDAYYDITKFRLYRTVTGTIGSVFYEVTEVTIGGATDTYADNNSNATIINTGITLETEEYDPPETTMKGIVNFPNGVLVGFFGNQLCFSEPFRPHAWPTAYRLTLDWNIVAIAVVGTSVICATEGNPTIVSGNHPSSMTQSRIDIIYPCVSKRSMVNMGWGAVYASNAGLVMIGIGGNDLITKQIHYWDTWKELPITSIVAKYYDNKYFASYGTGSFIFERDDQIGGHFTDVDYIWTTAYYDHLNAKFYFATSSTLYLWNDSTQPLTEVDWKSKVLKFKAPVNLGAARVIADYDVDLAAVTANAAIAASNASLLSGGTTRGAWNTKAYNEKHAFNESDLQVVQSTGGLITFQLFANKELIFQRDVSNSEVFRLPRGYKSDTYEVRVSGKARIRAIHVGETPLGLKAI